MANGPVYYTIPVRQGYEFITYIGSISGAVSTYSSKLTAAYTETGTGGLPKIYSPTAIVQGFSAFEPNETYLLFTKEAFSLGVSGNYIPPQPAKFVLPGAGFHSFGFDSNCKSTPLTALGPLISTPFGKATDVPISTVVAVNPKYGPGAPPNTTPFVIWYSNLGNQSQPFELYNLSPLSSYYANTTNTVVVSAKRIVNLLLTDDGRFLLTDAPGYSAIQVSVESP